MSACKRLTRLAAITILGIAATSTLPVSAQQVPTTPHSRYHAIAEYWQMEAKGFADGATTATSATKKSVWQDAAAYFSHGAAHFEALAEADDNAIAAAREKAASRNRGTASQPQLPPRMAAPLPLTPILPSIPGPASSQPGSSPLAAALEEATRCRLAADVFAKDQTSFDEMTGWKRHYEQCHVPELRALATDYRERALTASETAGTTPQATAATRSCGWNCIGHWAENEADRRKDALKRKSELLDEIADHLSSRADAIGSGADEATAPGGSATGTTTAERPGPALCRALGNAPANGGENDPYLLSDCLDEYMTGRLAVYYSDMRERVERYLWSATLLDAELSNDRKYEWRYRDGLLFEIVARQPAATDQYEWRLALMEYEISRARASWPREIETGSGLVPTAPAEVLAKLKNVRQVVYRGIRDRISALWRMYFEEIDLGVNKIWFEQEKFDWALFYKSLGELKALNDATIAPQVAVHTDPIDWSGFISGEAALCARDNETSYTRVREASSEMLAAVAPLRFARTQLIADLLKWEALAEQDGWPASQSEFSFKTVADQLWQTSWAGTWDKHSHEAMAIGFHVPAPAAGSREYFPPGEPVDQRLDSGISKFFQTHDSCTLWRPSVPLGIYMMTTIEKPFSSQPISVEPTIAKDLINGIRYGGYGAHSTGPLAQVALGRAGWITSYGNVALLVHLFERASNVMEAYFSGADSRQSP